MAVKFSLAPLQAGNQVDSPSAFDMGQALQIGANIGKQLVATKEKEQDDIDQSNFFQANIAYRNRSMDMQTSLQEAGNDLNAQRGVLDSYNDDVRAMADSYNLNEKHTSTFTSSIENASSKLEGRYRGSVNRQNKNVVESNITDVIANSVSLTGDDWKAQAEGLKIYAEKEGHTPQQASQMITKAYIHSQLAGLDPEEMTKEQAEAIRKDTLENLANFDDRLPADIAYKQARGTLDNIVDATVKKEKAEFDAYLGYSQITKGAMNTQINTQVKRGIYGKEEGEYKKWKYEQKLIKQEASAEALRISKGNKTAKVAKELRKPIVKQFKDVLNNLKVNDRVPIEVKPEDVERMNLFNAGENAVGVEALKFNQEYKVKYNMRHNPDLRQQVIESPSIAFSGSVNENVLKKELTRAAKDSFGNGDFDTVATLYKNWNIKGIAGDSISRDLQNPTTMNRAFAVFSELEGRGIAKGMMNKKTYNRVRAYQYKATQDEEGNFVLAPNEKEKIDTIINNPNLVSVDMEDFNEEFEDKLSGNYLDNLNEYKIRVSLGEDSDDVANELEDKEDMYHPVDGVDLSGLELDTSKLHDEMELIIEKVIGKNKSEDGQSYTGYSYNKTDKQFYLSTPTDKYNKATGFKDHNKLVEYFGKQMQGDDRTSFIEVVEPTQFATGGSLWDSLFHKPTEAERKAFTKSAGR